MITKKEYNYVVNQIFLKDSPYAKNTNSKLKILSNILTDCINSVLDELEYKTYSKRELLKIYKEKYKINIHSNNKAFCIILSYIINKFDFKVRIKKEIGEKVFKII